MTQDSQVEPLIEVPAEKPPTKLQRVAMGGVCCFVFSIVYVLMAGPMVWLNETAKFPPFGKLLQILYAPLMFLVKNDIEPFKSVLQWYIGLFR